MGSLRTCAIMQPTYLPWAGYFNLISQADEFVFLDDVQFSKQSWQQRNRILIQDEPRWLSVSCHHAGLSTLIMDVQVNDATNWRRKHLDSIRQSYSWSPAIQEIMETCRVLEDMAATRLADINILIISAFRKKLKISEATRIHRSSEIPASDSRIDRLVSICKHLNCNRYLSPEGASTYLTDDSFAGTGIELCFNSFNPPVYPQHGTVEFVSHLSIIDVVANLGWEGARNYIYKTDQA